MEEDYYKLLGVKRSATKEELEAAFKKQARKFHPDVNPDPNAQKQFQKIQQAFEVLSDDNKRALYDQYGPDFESMGGGFPGGGFPGGGFPGGGFPGGFGQGGGAHINLADILGGNLGDILGQTSPRQQTRRPQRGGDLQHTATISFKKSIEGGAIELRVQRRTGKHDTISLKIPPGVEDGAKMRLKGQGDPSLHGGKPGDIVVTIQVKPHAHFRRNGKNLEVTVPVTLSEAVLGGKIDVPTPVGVVSLKVPPGSSSGARLRVKGQGVKRKNESPGDLFVVLQIELPADLNLSEEEKTLLENIASRYTENVRNDLSW